MFWQFIAMLFKNHGCVGEVRTLCEHRCKKVIVMCRKRTLFATLAVEPAVIPWHTQMWPNSRSCDDGFCSISKTRGLSMGPLQGSVRRQPRQPLRDAGDVLVGRIPGKSGAWPHLARGPRPFLCIVPSSRLTPQGFQKMYDLVGRAVRSLVGRHA